MSALFFPLEIKAVYTLPSLALHCPLRIHNQANTTQLNKAENHKKTRLNMKYLTLLAAATLAVAAPATNSTLEERSFTGNINFFKRWDCQRRLRGTWLLPLWPNQSRHERQRPRLDRMGQRLLGPSGRRAFPSSQHQQWPQVHRHEQELQAQWKAE